jgi:histone H3/H4
MLLDANRVLLSLLLLQVGMMEDSNLCAIHAKRVTIM